MKEINQNITGDNNVQVGVNNGQIIHTKKVKKVTEVLHTPGLHITDSQAKKIKDKITEIADMVATKGGVKATIFKQEYRAFYNQFDCTSYKTLPIDQFDNAILWLSKRTGYKGIKALRTGDTPEWRKKHYTGIYARSKQLGMDKVEMLIFAQDKLELKEPLASIKELSDTRLKKLYTLVMSKRVK